MKQCEKMEKELRFVLLEEEYQTFKQRAQEHALLFRAGQTLVETTTMYDNPNPQYTFY